MPGIYLHIPFCKQACHYCDFHFSTSLNNKEALLKAMREEISLRKDFFKEDESGIEIDTIYFGGGTPSLLNQRDLFELFEELAKNFKIKPKAEISLECNPDDLDDNKLKELRQTPINRLSIGIQSFNQSHLNYMNRAHNSYQGINSIMRSQDFGFENISIDLIYGFPELSHEQWQKNLDTAYQLQIPHISSYCMTVEPKTALNTFIKKGKVPGLNEEQAVEHFEMLTEFLLNKGYEHYEISNFAFPDKHSRHNSNYWKGEKYLGVGPSAHSYNLKQRMWNVANNALYIKNISEHKPFYESETLTNEQNYNEYILTSLRTMWGSDLKKIENFGKKYLAHCLKESHIHQLNGDIYLKDEKLFLSPKGKIIADKIASDLFWV